MRTTLIATLLVVAVAVGLSARSSSSLADAGSAPCKAFAALAASHSPSTGDSTLIALANADDATLLAAGQSYVDAPLTQLSEGEPYLARAIKVCAGAAYTTPTGD